LNYLHDKYASYGVSLTISDFQGAFRSFWPKCTQQFLKLETRFEYVEVDNASWNAFSSGDTRKSLSLLREGLNRSLPFYERVRALKINSHRIRPVRWPLTRYLQWEFLSYEESIRQGQRVSLYDLAADNIPPLSELSDFILFDDFACMLHCYSERGEFEKATLVESPEIICEIAQLHATLAAKARPFHEVVKFNLSRHTRIESQPNGELTMPENAEGDPGKPKHQRGEEIKEIQRENRSNSGSNPNR
jgi:hypothetical protein